MAPEYPFEGASSRRVLALQDYAAIGDGRSVALIGLDGSVGWCCVPNLDSEPLFDSLLDAKGGGVFTVQPAGAFSAKSVYLKDSNVLETTFTTENGVMRITDSMNSSMAGRLPWCELARRVEDSTVSVFDKDSEGIVRHVYTAHPRMAPNIKERGIDLLALVWSVLDLTPAGRDQWYPSLTYGTKPIFNAPTGAVPQARSGGIPISEMGRSHCAVLISVLCMRSSPLS